MSANKASLRAELFKCAVRGTFPTYSDMLPFLQPRIQQGWRTEWSDDLNQIAMEEISHGYPDITYILHRSDKNSPYPVKLFRDAHNPDPTQLAALHSGVAEIIRLYCPPDIKDPYP